MRQRAEHTTPSEKHRRPMTTQEMISSEGNSLNSSKLSSRVTTSPMCPTCGPFKAHHLEPKWHQGRVMPHPSYCTCLYYTACNFKSSDIATASCRHYHPCDPSL